MSLITVFDPWKNNLCTCPDKYSLSPYTGCSHACLYCYASSYIRDFSHPRPKKELLKRLAKEIKKIPTGSIITLANSSDPYQPLEKKLKLTRDALKILASYDLKINIVTKSCLVLRDLDILKKLKKVVVCLSITTLDKNLAKKIEPKASSPKERLKAVKELSAYLPVAVRLDPLIYPLNTSGLKDIVEKIKKAGAKQIITSTYKEKPDNLKRMVSSFSQYKSNWPAGLKKKLIEKVREITLSQGLEFSSCREGFKTLNTAACDGSS
jgi:DNA repair photolyase